ncbi:hypothetical protein SmJEL517_g00401 [Synchytrium microbalum]|uniref:Kinesin motor domain-containing protein n=1 Tax=Synchytrium microbalum TaxID=1806994 RepID=A0A507C8R2_9FUNG|nr:uncharacterized protein SmJEL517_g00401 [Synchytrium microbalum]TPX37980.1 hypothetical protein SmJEL517_g00401 [Synchytrium microbalum]
MSTTSSVKVAVRVRPLTAREVLQEEAKECLSYVPNEPQLILTQPSYTWSNSEGKDLGPVKSFTYDHVFSPDVGQSLLFEECVRSLLNNYLNGFHCTILAYGQTGSGKTYTMGTGLDLQADPDTTGIVPRAIHVLFETLRAKHEGNPEGFRYSVYVSFLELHNEELVDLLNPRRASTLSNLSTSVEKGWGGLTIREDTNGNIVWSGVREEEAKTPEDCLGYLAKGSLCRTTASTDMNATSSRSHAIFSVTLKQQIWTATEKDDPTPVAKDPETPVAGLIGVPDTSPAMKAQDPLIVNPRTHPDGSWQRLNSKFHFVDLAGSERLKRTNAEGDRKKEGISINQGLLALGNVISALGDETRRASHVPYRDSKLTRLLQDSLGGNSQTMMLACVSPADTNMNETRNTLEYANRAKNIKNRVTINQEWSAIGAAEKDREIRALRTEVSHLRTQLSTLRSQGWGGEEAERSAAIASAFHGVHEPETSFAGAGREDLEAQIQKLLLERESKNFEHERLQFRCQRLQNTVNELAQEASIAAAERDQVLNGLHVSTPKKSRIVVSDGTQVVDSEENDEKTPTPIRRIFGASTQFTVEEGNVSSRGIGSIQESKPSLDSFLASHNPADVLPAALIEAYNTTIYDLKLRLSESEDKAAWYHDVVVKLGKPVRVAGQAPVSVSRQSNRPPAPSRTGMSRNKSHEGLPSKRHAGSKSEESILSVSSMARSEAEGRNSAEIIAEDESHPAESDEAQDDEVASEAESATTDDMYCVVQKIQADIADHEALASRLARRESEYEAMRGAYESKLRALSDQLVRVERERDMAMTRAKGEKSVDEKPGTVALKARYEDRTKKLAAEISELKKKWQANKKSMTTARSENESLIRNLKASVDALKSEKAKVLKKLREEEMRVRDIAASKDRELASVLRRERQAAENAKKMERNNHLQRMMLSRRPSEEVHNNKLKSVLSILKRSPSANKVLKREPLSPRRHGATRRLPSSGSSSSLLTNRSGSPRPKTAPSSPSWTAGLGIQSSVPLDTTAPISLRAQFKKQVLDAELLSFVKSRLRQQDLETATSSRIRLVGELKELRAERQRCVEADIAEGIPERPQYMDERIQQVESEISTLESRLKEWNADGISIKDTQESWQNAVNLLQSLESSEKQVVAELLMSDLSLLMTVDHEREVRVRQAEAAAAELGVALAKARTDARNAALDYESELERARQKLNMDDPEMESVLQRISEYMQEAERPFSPKRKTSNSNLPDSDSPRRRRVNTSYVNESAELLKRLSRSTSPTHGPSSIDTPSYKSEIERPSTPTKTRNRAPSWTYGNNPLDMPENKRDGSLASVEVSESVLQGGSAEIQSASSEDATQRNSIAMLPGTNPGNSNQSSTSGLWSTKPKKAAGGGMFLNDVFERLASSHTLASQAKVKATHLGVNESSGGGVGPEKLDIVTTSVRKLGPAERSLSVNTPVPSSSNAPAEESVLDG